MTHSNAQFLNIDGISEGYFLRQAISFMNKVDWRRKKKEKLDAKSIEAIKEVRRQGNKGFQNERIIHYHAV